jgi:hypothetical protein
MRSSERLAAWLLAFHEIPPSIRSDARSRQPSLILFSLGPMIRPITPTVVVLQAAMILGALLFVGATFRKPWVYAAWVKLAFWLSGFSVLVVAGLTFLMSSHAFHWALFETLFAIKMFFMGLVTGMLLLFFLSGEVVRGYRRWRELRREARSPSLDVPKA